MAANVLFNVPVARKIRRKEDFLDISKFSDRELRERFHFGLEAILFITDLLTEKLQRVTKRSYALTPLQQVLITLRFFASGSFLQNIGDCMGVDKSTVSRVVSDVTDAIVDISQRFIRWPCEASEKQRIRTGFFSLGGFPNVIGCIDGTHIRIQAPTEDEKSYVNRKSYHSINVMAVCNDRGEKPHPLITTLSSNFITNTNRFCLKKCIFLNAYRCSVFHILMIIKSQ